MRATEDLVDDALDRAGDFECGLRRSVSRALDDDDYDHRGHDDHDCDDYDDDDWDGYRDRRRRGGHGRRGDGPRRRLGPDEGEPYASGPRPGSRLRSDNDIEGDPDELTALKDQLELLRGRMDRRLGEGDHFGGRGRAPRARGAEDAEVLKDELARLADRIDRVRDAR
ncbi:hypothetical protein ACFPH6_08150 [Streptomyces xiangluensis]|uniref:Uncharacterized protein n=1 Tax=Streptomyces xiangluensis TaxID=2665720 RepID=A0ABV8YMX6_9ACTN